jgi:hypothetical protein
MNVPESVLVNGQAVSRQAECIINLDSSQKVGIGLLMLTKIIVGSSHSTVGVSQIRPEFNCLEEAGHAVFKLVQSQQSHAEVVVNDLFLGIYRNGLFAYADHSL